MPEKLNNTIERRILKKWVIISLCLITGWLLLGWHHPPIFFFSFILYFSLIICGLFLDIPNKYLVSAIYMLAIIHDIIVKSVIGNQTASYGEAALFLNFLGIIFISVLIFGYKIIKREKGDNKEERREAIIKKLLYLITSSIIFITLDVVFIFILMSK